MRVLFWGTSDYALPTLRALLASPHTVAGVVTQPDRPAGRGRALRATPVKRAAVAAGLPVLQPGKPRGEAFMAEMAAVEADVSVVAAYGEILTEAVLEAPPRGTVNVHASLLPELRGAAPINWAIIRGHRESGVTIIRLVRELDAGPILAREAVPIGPETTAGELFGTLSELGASLLIEVLGELERDAVEPREQDHDRATYAPKLDRDTARLDWSAPAEEVGRWIRGCDPWPAAWSLLEPEEGAGGEPLPVQLFRPRPLPERPGEGEAGGGAAATGGGEAAAPGTVLRADSGDGLVVAAGRGAVEIVEVKAAGSRRMDARAWIRGRGARRGQRFV